MMIFIPLFIIAFTLIYIYYKLRLTYWLRRHIAHERPKFPCGNLKEAGRAQNFFEIVNDVYAKYNGTGPFVGFFVFLKPGVITLDLTLLKNVLLTDNHLFTPHRKCFIEMDRTLMSFGEPKWHKLRHCLTTERLKNMYPQALSIAVAFTDNLKLKTEQGPVVLHMHDYIQRFIVDVLATCMFGFQCGCVENANAEFYTFAKEMLEKSTVRPCRICRSIKKVKAFWNGKNSLEVMYREMIKNEIQQRATNHTKRNDFLDMLIEMNSQESIGTNNVDDLAKQAMHLFLNGFQTLSTALTLALYELAKNSQIQADLRQEINDVYAQHNREFTIECLHDMAYAKRVIDETLRYYPPIPLLMRECQRNYQSADAKYYIEKSTYVLIPIYAIHHDEQYYPEPQYFDPRRFDTDAIEQRPEYTWLPFGVGAHNCMGYRFSQLLLNFGLSLLIKQFRFNVGQRTPHSIEFNKHSRALHIESEIYLSVERI